MILWKYIMYYQFMSIVYFYFQEKFHIFQKKTSKIFVLVKFTNVFFSHIVYNYYTTDFDLEQ